MADRVNLAKHGTTVTFAANHHINPTNICTLRKTCVFCSYARLPKEEGAYRYTMEQIWAEAATANSTMTREFHIVGGLDMKAVLDVIGKGAAQSWQMDNRGHTMVDGKFDFGFAVDWMRKDLGLCLDEARRNRAPLPITALIDQFYGDVQRAGGGRYDTSSLITRLRQQ